MRPKLKNMKHLFTISLLFIGLLSSFAQTDEAAVPFGSYWFNGDSYNFKVTKINQQWRGDTQSKNDTTTYNATFTVLDSTETSYKIRWSYDTELPVSIGIPEEVMESFSNLSAIDVIYTTSEVGAFIEIENWKEISDKMTEMLENVMSVLAKNEEVDKKKVSTALKPILSIYQTQLGIEQLVFKELQLFHFPFGVEFMVAETLKYDDAVPNIFGGDPIKGHTQLYIDKVDFDEAYCSLIQEMQLDPIGTRNMIMDFLKRSGIKGSEMKKMMETASIEVTDYNKYEFYYYPGVPIHIEAKRESLIDISDKKAKRIDILIIELL